MDSGRSSTLISVTPGGMALPLAFCHLGDFGKRELPTDGFPEFGSCARVKLIGMSNCLRVPGFHRHARSASTALSSSIPNPVDFKITTCAGRLLAGFTVTRKTPRP